MDAIKPISAKWRYVLGFFILSSLLFILLSRYNIVLADDDELKAAAKTISGTFGKDSTFIKVLYLVEIMAAVIGYIKSRNLLVFAGIIGISIFVNLGFSTWAKF